MQDNKISIIVPVYNVEGYIPECLDSLVNQTYDNIEIIIINDGSTDNSNAVVERYAAKDRRIRYFSQQNAGLSATRNFGLGVATGSYIMFVDSDDYIDLRTCEILNAKISLFEGCDIVLFGRCRFGDDYKIFDVVGDHRYRGSGTNFILESVKNNYFTATAWNKIYRRDLLISNNLSFVEGVVYEDLLFVFKAMAFSEHLLVEPTPLYFYRYNRPDSIINTVKDADVDVLVTVKGIDDFVREHMIDLSESAIIDQLIFGWVANSVCFKYPKRYLFCSKANRVVKQILADPIYLKYVRRIIKDSSAPKSWRVAAFLSIHSYPLFVLTIYTYGRLSLLLTGQR